MKKLINGFILNLFVSCSLTTVSCQTINKKNSYSNFIIGADIVNFDGNFTRNKNVSIDFDSTSTDLILNVNNATSDQFFVVNNANESNIFYTYQNATSFIFGTNSLIDFSSWEYIPANNNNIVNRSTIDFSTNSFNFIIFLIQQTTDFGDYIQIQKPDKSTFTLVVNFKNFKDYSEPEIDLSVASSDIALPINLSQTPDESKGLQIEVALLTQALTNGISSLNARYMAFYLMIKSLMTNPNYQTIVFSQLFDFSYSSNANMSSPQNGLPSSPGNYYVGMKIKNKDLASGLYLKAKFTNQTIIPVSIT